MTEQQTAINLLKSKDLEYEAGFPSISDLEYDILKSETQKLYPHDKYFETVGAPVFGADVKHKYILGSLFKKKFDGSMASWVRSNNIKVLSCSSKLDGVSVYIDVENRKVALAATRGDGYVGKNVTDKIEKIFPKTLTCDEFLSVRCEAVMEDSVARNLGYKNARNAVAGILNSKDGLNIEHVTLLFYQVYNKEFERYSDHIKFLKSIGLLTPTSYIIEVGDDIDKLEERLADELRQDKESGHFGIDGIVVGDDSRPDIGSYYFPSNIVAFKVNEDATTVKVTGVQWNIGRTGKITPVVLIEPTDINGSTISKATGFNARYIIDNNIYPGCEVGLVKSGDVIPFIVESYSKDKEENTDIPVRCPSCDSRLKWTNSSIDLMCNNPECPEILLYKTENFLLSHGCEEMTYTTLKNLGVENIFELYSLDEFSISMIDGFGTKRAGQIMKEIDKTLHTTQEKLLKSFGIDGVGNTISKVVMNYFTIDQLFTVSADELMKIDGVGSIMAANIQRGIAENKELYDFLIEKGLKFEELKSSSLKGKVFTLTGKSDMKRNDIVSMISANGGMVKGISKTVDYLVTDDPNGSSSKTQKARVYGTKIISYEQLMSMIN